MAEKNRKSFLSKVGDNLWLVLIIFAIVIVSFSMLANKGTDFTRIASRKVERLLEKRVDVLED